MKRVVTMQDISCVGKCSLTVALPILSALGTETAVLPTAVLSTHTMFKGFTFRDLTEDLRPVMAHWAKEGFDFDAVYTGYLGSFEQIDIAAELIDRFGKDKPVIIDPCMADNGKLYPGFTPEFAAAMAKLCAKANIICPNLTEASFLLDIPYTPDYDEDTVKEILKKLAALGPETAILTGISFREGTLGAYGYNRTEDTFFYRYTEEQVEHFHGTGDIWASTLTGALVQGYSMEDAVQLACDFVCESIRLTLAEENHNTYGVNFEQALWMLAKKQ